jgi:hypothetical protein
MPIAGFREPQWKTVETPDSGGFETPRKRGVNEKGVPFLNRR